MTTHRVAHRDLDSFLRELGAFFNRDARSRPSASLYLPPLNLRSNPRPASARERSLRNMASSVGVEHVNEASCVVSLRWVSRSLSRQARDRWKATRPPPPARRKSSRGAHEPSARSDPAGRAAFGRALGSCALRDPFLRGAGGETAESPSTGHVPAGSTIATESSSRAYSRIDAHVGPPMRAVISRGARSSALARRGRRRAAGRRRSASDRRAIGTNRRLGVFSSK